MPQKGRTWSWSDEARKRLSQKLKGKKPTNINYELRSKKRTKYVREDDRVYKCFHWMQTRCSRGGRKCDFPRTPEGFKAFCKEIGPIPDTIKIPSVGRKDHDYGYVYGNIAWEEYDYNRWKQRKVEDQRNKKQESKDEIPF